MKFFTPNLKLNVSFIILFLYFELKSPLIMRKDCSFKNYQDQDNLTSLKSKEFTSDNKQKSSKFIINPEEMLKSILNYEYFTNVVKNDNKENISSEEGEVETYLSDQDIAQEHLVKLTQSTDSEKYSKITDQIKKFPENLINIIFDYLINDHEIRKSLEILINNQKYISNYILINNSNNIKDKNSIKNQTRFLQYDPDADPPKPYTSLDIPCRNSAECFAKKIKWMKCTIVSVALRTSYETLNIPILIMGKITFGLCGCSVIPKGSENKVKCKLTSGMPGLPCSITNQILKGLYKITFNLWKGYQSASHNCKNPISPF